MKRTLVLLLAAVTLSASAQTNKYGIKSAIVTFEQVTDMGSMKIKNKVIVYFDDYGMKECRETYEGDKVKEAFFSDGKNLYLLIPADKSVYDRGSAYRGTELRFDWNEVSKKDKESGKAKKLPNVVIAGKQCESFQVGSKYGTTVFAGWKNITLLTSNESKSMKTTVKAVKVEENAKVPPEKFKVPADVPVKKM